MRGPIECQRFKLQRGRGSFLKTTQAPDGLVDELFRVCEVERLLEESIGCRPQTAVQHSIQKKKKKKILTDDSG